MSRRCHSPLKLELWIHLQICFAFSFFLTRGASEGRNLNRDQQNWRSVILNWGSTAELKPTKTCSCFAGMTFAKNTVFQNMLKIRSKWHSLTPWELSVMTGFSIDKNCGLSVTGASKAGFSICQCGQAPQTACQPTWAATSGRLWIFWIWASNGRKGRECVWGVGAKPKFCMFSQIGLSDSSVVWETFRSVESLVGRLVHSWVGRKTNTNHRALLGSPNSCFLLSLLAALDMSLDRNMKWRKCIRNKCFLFLLRN